MNILTIGAGSWGTALTYLLDKNNNKCYLWEFNEEYRKLLIKDRENKNFLPGFKLSENIEIISDINKVLRENHIDIVIMSTPTQFVRNTLKTIDRDLLSNKIIVNVAKGIEISTSETISMIVEEYLSGLDYSYVLLSGPTHAEEVIQDLPSAILSVSKNEEAAKIVQHLFSNNNLRVYTGNDVIGSEIGGALKNCLAICAGISDGLGYGDNTKAALLTRGLSEIVRIGVSLGAKKETFLGLTGIGDMIVTCTSKHSRNRYLGEQIGKGRKLSDIVSEMKMVSEGADTIKAVVKITNDKNISAPIFKGLYKVLYEDFDVTKLTQVFMDRNLKSEF